MFSIGFDASKYIHVAKVKLQSFQDNIVGVCQISVTEIKKLPLNVMERLMKSDNLDAHCAEAAFKVRKLTNKKFKDVVTLYFANFVGFYLSNYNS